MPEIDIGSFLQTLVQRSRLTVAQQIQSSLFQPVFPAEVKKILRKSQPQILEKLRKLSLKKSSVFLIKKNV